MGFVMLMELCPLNPIDHDTYMGMGQNLLYITYYYHIRGDDEYPFTSYLDVPWGPGTGEALKKLVLPVVKCLLVYKKMN
jgi:hypothetical protein